ncbi:MAG: peptide ABC transporter permease [Bdellovibrionaceae bacterium]|nr:peptide ABC transporter permease [Pseudobdellovibrionaceae bacterium]|tara:strand:- start:2952 stop:3971 length:1020 start_codon:yes stop_codon:yes gene_type:complete
MIERWIKNDLTLKRLRRFKSIRRARISVWVFLFLIFLSATAEFWANNKPIVMTHKGSIYFPVVKTYHPSVFGLSGFVTNYRSEAFHGEDTWALWPLVRWNPLESNKSLESYPAPPSEVNWLGTDDRGRDVLSRLIYGFRYSIGFAVLVWFFSYLMGVILGGGMGFFGGKLDLFGQRVVEIFESLPSLLMLLTLIAMLGASMSLLVAFSVLLGWMRISAYMRAEFLKLRRRDFVDASRALGVKTPRILFRHVLPNAMSPIITFSPVEIAGGIYTLAILDYLGLGLPPPTPSWGELLQQAQNYFSIAWWLAVFPSLAIIISLTSLTFIGEGVREAFDPRKS